MMGWVCAQIAPSGTIEGHVTNATNGQSLHRARIVLAGSALETFSDDNGDFRLVNVPVGDLQVSAAYSGLDTKVTTVRVNSAQIAHVDFILSSGQRSAAEDASVILDPLIVSENREVNAQRLSINEERYAANIKSVSSAEEHGDIGESNFGEFIKYLPGISVNYSGGVIPTDVTVRGFPPSATQITMDGGEIASAGVANTNRQFDLSTFQVANNLARVEVAKTPTPDTPANMLGGTVNLVTRSAFERSRPQFSYRAYATSNSNTLTGNRPAPGLERTTNSIQPGLDFSYVVPVNKRFGFTVSGAFNSRYFNLATSESTWDQAAYILQTYQVYDSMQYRQSSSGGVTADWKFGDGNLLSMSLNDSASHTFSDQFFNRGAMGAGPTGGATFSQSNGARGSYNATTATFDRLDQTWHGSLRFRHDGRVWRIDGTAFFSNANNHMRYVDKGGFQTLTATLASVVARFDRIGQNGHPGPGAMSATTAAGAPVDIYDANNFLLLTANDGRRSANAFKSGGQLNAARHFDFAVPIDLKAGVYLNRERREQRLTPMAWTFLGPDRVANNADNRVGLYDFIANIYSAYPRPYGFPQGKFISAYKVWEYYKAHPEQFSLNEVTAYTGRVNGSTLITETVSAAYVRGDLHLMNNRLWLIGGVRFEDTSDVGDGPRNDINAALQKDASGRLVRNAQGRTIPITTDPLQNAHLQFKERGTHADRSYSGYYPSLNLAYNLTDNLTGRLAYARTIGRPQFNNILPGMTISDPDVANPTIRLNNTGLKPWTADAYDATLEYYFTRSAQLSLGAYRKNIANFVGSVAADATPEQLNQLGLPSDYSRYDIVTTTNIGNARITGFEFNYRQALDFLPPWARGLQVFANGTFNKLEGDRTADFTNFAKRNINWGVSLSRSRGTVKLNWLHSGEIRGAFQGAPDIYFYTPARTTLDISGEVRLFRHWSLYGTARNATNARVLRERRGSANPPYAVNNRYFDIGAYVSAGIKGEF